MEPWGEPGGVAAWAHLAGVVGYPVLPCAFHSFVVATLPEVARHAAARQKRSILNPESLV